MVSGIPVKVAGRPAFINHLAAYDSHINGGASQFSGRHLQGIARHDDQIGGLADVDRSGVAARQFGPGGREQ